MYGIFTYIWSIFEVNVGKYSSTMVRIWVDIVTTVAPRAFGMLSLLARPGGLGVRGDLGGECVRRPRGEAWSKAVELVMKKRADHG